MTQHTFLLANMTGASPFWTCGNERPHHGSTQKHCHLSAMAPRYGTSTGSGDSNSGLPRCCA